MSSRFRLALALVLLVGGSVPARAGVTIETIAGGLIGDGRIATTAPIVAKGLAVDHHGNVYVSHGNRVRRIDAETGVIQTVAGRDADGTCGEDGPALDACLDNPRQLAVLPNGDLLIAEFERRVLRLDQATGRLVRFAGGPEGDCSGMNTWPPRDGVPARDSCLVYIADIAADAAGNVFIAEPGDGRVRRVDGATGLLSTVVGSDDVAAGACAEDAPGTSCRADVDALAVDRKGDVYLAMSTSIRRLDAVTGRISTVVGRDFSECRRDQEGVAPRDACVGPVLLDIVVDDHGALYYVENWRLKRVNRRRHDVRTVAGVEQPSYVDVDPAGRLVVVHASDRLSAMRVSRFDERRDHVTPLGGNGTAYQCGDGGPANEACLGAYGHVRVGPDGAILLTQWDDARVRRIDPTTLTIATVAGDGRNPYVTSCPDGVAATATCLNELDDAVADSAGNLFIADGGTFGDEGVIRPDRLRRVDAATGLITTIAGGGCEWGRLAEDGPVATACPAGSVEIDRAGNLFLIGGASIRRIDAAAGTIRTVAGNLLSGFCGDGGPGTRACLGPEQATIDADGNVFFVDGYFVAGFTHAVGTRVRRVDAATGIITTVAGNGEPFACGDGLAATEACVPAESVLVDRDGALLIAAYGTLRRVDPVSGIIETVIGDPAVNCLATDGGPAFDGCVAADALDAEGRVLFLDPSARLRRLRLPRGDGILDGGESCDDGNRENGDGCDANCTPTACGNGVVTAGEVCDDGNRSDADCCTAACAAALGRACDDRDACTSLETCDARGVCVADARRSCDAGVCRAAGCDAATGSCENVPRVAFDYLYEDGDPCTLGEICIQGEPFPGEPNCDDFDPCTVDRCVSGDGCAHAPLPEAERLPCQCRSIYTVPKCHDEYFPPEFLADWQAACDRLAAGVATAPSTSRRALLRRAVRALRQVRDEGDRLWPTGQVRGQCIGAAHVRLDGILTAVRGLIDDD